MRNPWLGLPHAEPFVLAEDADQIERFNRTAKDNLRIRLELLPEPSLGNPDAPIVILGLNPGFSTDDPQCHSDPEFARSARNNLAHCSTDYPFYLELVFSKTGGFMPLIGNSSDLHGTGGTPFGFWIWCAFQASPSSTPVTYQGAQVCQGSMYFYFLEYPSMW